jgi:hypothetical protein
VAARAKTLLAAGGLGLGLAALGCLAFLLSGHWFLRSLECHGFSAESAHIQGGVITTGDWTHGRAVLLAGGQEGEASVGFSEPVRFWLGRVRAAFRLRHRPTPGDRTAGPVASLHINIRGRAQPLARRLLSAGELASGRAWVECDLGQAHQRLEFWLTYWGEGPLWLDSLEISRPGWWGAAAGRLLASPDPALWDPLRNGPWRHLDGSAMPAAYHRTGFIGLSRRLTRGLAGRHQQARALYRYVARQLAMGPAKEGIPALHRNRSHWDILAGGLALCDTQARVLGELVGRAGFVSRVTCADFQPVSPASHCVLEIMTGRGWAVADPFLGLAFYDRESKRLLGFPAVANDPGLLVAHPKYRELNDKLQKELLAFFANPREVLNERQPYPAADTAMPGWLWRFWARRLQDHYLQRVELELNDPPRMALVRARHLELFGRNREALRHYRLAVAANRPPRRSAAVYHLARLQGRLDRAGDCRRYQALVPAGKGWDRRARRALGQACGRAGEGQ